MNKHPLVSIIIPTYNSQADIGNCLRSIGKISYPNYEVVVVDNHSADQTRQIVSKFGQRVQLIKNKINLGFAAAVNLGVKQAKGELALILNPDTMVQANFVQPLVKVLSSDQRIAVCQPAVFLLSSPDKLNLSGKVVHYLGFDWLRDYRQKLIRQSGPIDSFSGSAFLISKQLFAKVGGLDERYFMYYEDSDLAWRLKLLGYRLQFVAESQIYHDYKFMPREDYLSASRKFFYAERNRLMTIGKNYTAKTLLLVLPALIFFELGMIGFALANGWLTAKLKSYRSLWQLRTHILRERSRIQPERVITDQQFTANFQGQISFVHFQNPVLKLVANPVLSIYWSTIRRLI